MWRSRVEDPWVKARKCTCSPAKAPTHTPGQLSLMNKEDALWPPVLASHAPQRCSLQYSRQPLSKRNYSKGPQRASGLIKWKVGLRVSLLHTTRQFTLSLGHLTVACSRYAFFPVLRGCKMLEKKKEREWFHDFIQQKRRIFQFPVCHHQSITLLECFPNH